MILTTHIHYHAVRQRKKKRNRLHAYWKEINRNFVFTNNACPCKKSLVIHQKENKNINKNKNLFALLSNFSTVAVYKVSANISIMFLYTSNQLESKNVLNIIYNI